MIIHRCLWLVHATELKSMNTHTNKQTILHRLGRYHSSANAEAVSELLYPADRKLTCDGCSTVQKLVAVDFQWHTVQPHIQVGEVFTLAFQPLHVSARWLSSLVNSKLSWRLVCDTSTHLL